MRFFSIALVICLALFMSAFAQEGENTDMAQGSVKITVAPAIKHVDGYTAATTFVKAADYAPEGGWGEKDMSKVYETIVTKGFEKVTGWLNDERKPAGPFFAIYFEDPEKTPAGDLTCKVGVPIAGEYDPTVDVIIEEMPAAEVASITYTGDYKNSMNAWDDLMKYVEKEGYTWAGNPMEIYLVSEGQTDKPDEWVTEIQWPIIKLDDKSMEKMEESGTTEQPEKEGE